MEFGALWMEFRIREAARMRIFLFTARSTAGIAFGG
jgi:hypothetical protein